MEDKELVFPGQVVCIQENKHNIGSEEGEGNGTPLQYSRLENPMDGGAWWAAVYEVARS